MFAISLASRKTGGLMFVAAATLAVVGLAGCSDSKDSGSSDSSSAATSVSRGDGSSAQGGTGHNESEIASAPPAPVVPSTSIESPNGTQVSIGDPEIIAQYAASGYDKGYLGKPLGPVVKLTKDGKFETFQGGSLYYNPELKKVFSVQGAIGGFWGEHGHELGELGYPSGDETRTDKGLEQKYEHGTLVFANGEVTLNK